MSSAIARCFLLLTIASIPDGVFTEKRSGLTHGAASFPRLLQGCSYSPGGDKISWIRREQDTPTSPWMRSTNTFSARYKIVDVASRLAGEELYVAGILPNEKSVIERWKFPRKKGRLVYSMTNPAPPIGTSAGAWSGSLSLHGGVLHMTTLPTTWYAPDITVILESSDYGFIRSMEIDPEGRFLLFNRYPDGDLYSIDLAQSTPTPTLLFSAAQHPELTTASTLDIGQHSTHGRVCVAKPADLGAAMLMSPVPNALYLIDANNDGIFETTQSVPLVTHEQSILIEPNATPVWSWPWALAD